MTEYTLSEPQDEQPAKRTLAAVYENEYDICGNLIGKKKFSADGTLVSSETYSYSYDEYGRMLQNDQYIYEYTNCTAEQYALYEKVKGSDFLYYW